MDGFVSQQRLSLRHLSAAQLASVVERSHARLCAVLVLLSLVCFLPGFTSLHPMDRDEPRYAQASKQMLETGDFVDIRFQDEARHKKPVGVYWMQAAAVGIAESLGMTDAVLTACSVAVFGGLARAYLWRQSPGKLSWRTLALFWTGLALGVLVKGPLVLLFG